MFPYCLSSWFLFFGHWDFSSALTLVPFSWILVFVLEFFFSLPLFNRI